MDEQKKRKALRTYFSRPKRGFPIFLLLVAAIAIFIGLADPRHNSEIGVIGFILGILAVVWLIIIGVVRGYVPDDSEVDRWFQEDVARITQQSLNKVGLVREQLVREPLPITGPILWATNGVPSQDLLWKKGKDDIVRFAVNQVTVIHLSTQLLSAYSCDYNFLKNVTLNDETNEYHYKDIVSVSTQEDSTSYTLPTGVRMVHSQAFRISVSSGESIKVTINANKLGELTKGTISTASSEQAVQVIRTMLREKKQ